MKQQDSARFLTNYEISDILQHIAAVVNSNPQKNDYLNNGETYTAVEGHTIGFIKDHPGCTATEIACEWGKTTSAVSQLLKNCGIGEWSTLCGTKRMPNAMRCI